MTLSSKISIFLSLTGTHPLFKKLNRKTFKGIISGLHLTTFVNILPKLRYFEGRNYIQIGLSPSTSFVGFRHMFAIASHFLLVSCIFLHILAYSFAFSSLLIFSMSIVTLFSTDFFVTFHEVSFMFIMTALWSGFVSKLPYDREL